ncbi:hypothetical protein [Saccharopolyspora sp. 5N708]|uniref:hypothetical protein n=1 Tax=Saccharopolyspora sp. 5N708 TaxID=3457424 RepID=UPI003FD40C9A
MQILAFCGLVVGAAVEAVLIRYLPWIGPLPAAVLAAAAAVLAHPRHRGASRPRA